MISLHGVAMLIELNAWKIVGLAGSATFGARFLLQWIASERVKKSVVPIGFWECSLLGSLLCLSYFIFYRHDSVGIITNLLPAPIYARNLFFKWREILANRQAVRLGVAPSATDPDKVENLAD